MLTDLYSLYNFTEGFQRLVLALSSLNLFHTFTSKRIYTSVSLLYLLYLLYLYTCLDKVIQPKRGHFVWTLVGVALVHLAYRQLR